MVWTINAPDRERRAISSPPLTPPSSRSYPYPYSPPPRIQPTPAAPRPTTSTMELYIPPPASFMPRLPPPRPVVPAVPIVPPPELPETVHAPEGPYTLTKDVFPHIGTPAAPIPQADPRMMPPPSFMGGAGGFIVAPPPGGAQAGQTAMSFGSSVVNGQTQPAWPVRMSWVSVWFPPRGDKGFLGMSGGGQGAQGQGQGAPPMSPGFDGASSDSSSDMGSDQPAAPMPMEVPLSALPQGQTGKRMPFTRGQTVSGANLPRPKNNLRSSNSTFVTRLQTYDGLLKMLQDRSKQGGEMARWGFWNLGRTVGWGEEGGKVKVGLAPLCDPYAHVPQEPLSRVTFSQVPTCHTVSHLTASPDRLDMIIGFASGDLVWLDFLIGRYTRINKGGLLNSNAVVSVHFDPRQPHQFIAIFADATLIQFNLFAEDPALPPAGPSGQTMPWTAFFERQQAEQVPVTPIAENHPGDQEKSEKDTHPKGEVYEDAMIIWKNEDWSLNQSDKKKGQELSPWAGRNPTAASKVGRGTITGQQAHFRAVLCTQLTGIASAYSPDGRWLAVVSDDGMLRLIDVTEERLTDTFAGYFGGLGCVRPLRPIRRAVADVHRSHGPPIPASLPPAAKTTSSRSSRSASCASPRAARATRPLSPASALTRCAVTGAGTVLARWGKTASSSCGTLRRRRYTGPDTTRTTATRRTTVWRRARRCPWQDRAGVTCP